MGQLPPLAKILLVCILVGAMQLTIMQLSSQNSGFLGMVKKEVRRAS